MSKNVFVAALVFIFLFSGCKKKDITEYGQLGLQLSTQIDSVMVTTEGFLYPSQNGTLLAINDARFYVSSVSVLSTNGFWYAIPNSLLLKIYENQNYNITSPVPTGTYTAIKFYVGLDSVTNASNPLNDTAAKGIDSVLSPDIEPNMYFGYGEGFKFFYFSGYVLTSGSHSPVAVNYQIGGNSNRQLVTLNNLNFTIQTGRVHFITIACDYGRLLEGISIATGANDNGNSFGSSGQMTTASLIADSIPNMFTYASKQ